MFLSQGMTLAACCSCLALFLIFVPAEAASRRRTARGVCPAGFEDLSGTCYYFSKEVEPSRDGAQRHCHQSNSELTGLESFYEDFVVRQFLEGIGRVDLPFWIGAFSRAGHGFEWPITGQPMVHSNWCANEPNNEYKNEFCAVIVKQGSNFCWNDAPCDLATPINFICERPYM